MEAKEDPGSADTGAMASASTPGTSSPPTGPAAAAGTSNVKSEESSEAKVVAKESPATATEPESKEASKEEKKAAEKRGNDGDDTEDSGRKKKKKDEKEVKVGRGRGALGDKGGTKAVGKGRGAPALDRRSPSSLAGSAANSPKKSRSVGDQSDSGEEDDSKKSTDSSGLKVPPLKIVLSGGAAPNGNGAPNQEQEKKAVPTRGASKDEANASNGEDSGGLEAGGDSKPTVSGSRMTRSRASHGPSAGDGADQGNSVDSTSSATLESRDNCDRERERERERAAPALAALPSTTTSSFSDYHVKKRKLRSQVEDSESSNSSGHAGAVAGGSSNAAGAASSSGAGVAASAGNKNAAAAAAASSFQGTSAPSEPLNDIQKYLNIRRQVEQRRKNLFPVQPKPPQGFKDYLMNRKTYLLQGNHERLRSIPVMAPPVTLEGPLRDLFLDQEKQRHDLRKKHQVEKEKLVLAVEQEILRVHGRAARALANQSLPYSVCTILKDEEIYAPIDLSQEEKNRDIRSRYNGRLFLSWLQDVDDKWEKIKEQMVLRHHNEAESLNAVQKMDWEWKVSDHYANVSPHFLPPMDDLHIPMVHVSDDFDLSDAK